MCVLSVRRVDILIYCAFARLKSSFLIEVWILTSHFLNTLTCQRQVDSGGKHHDMLFSRIYTWVGFFYIFYGNLYFSPIPCIELSESATEQGPRSRYYTLTHDYNLLKVASGTAS